MNRFIEAFRNLFRIPDLRNRVLFTLALLAVYRVGAYIPTPGINWRVLEMLQKERELGRRKITQYTRYLTIVLSVIQSITIATALQAGNLGGQALVYRPRPRFILM